MPLLTESKFQSLMAVYHVCAIYENADDHAEAAAAFIKNGLKLNERCVCIECEGSKLNIRQHLALAGVDVAGAVAAGKLLFRGQREVYLKDGGFNPDRMMQ